MGWRHKRDRELFVPIAPRYHPSAVLAAPPLRGRRPSPLSISGSLKGAGLETSTNY